jgi:hypothetical protein
VKVKLAKTSELRPYNRNPRLNESSISKVAKSIEAFGFRQPIVVDPGMVIVAGHTRFAAAMRLGLAKVPITIASDLTKAQIKAYRIADNRVAEDSAWDPELLKLEIGDLENTTLLPALGFEDDELQKLSLDDAPPTDNELDVEDQFGGATALDRGGSAPLRYWRRAGLLEGDVLDFGCGKEQHEFAKYDAFSHPDVAPLLTRYDVVMCNYVLNVQPSDHLVDLLCSLILNLLKPGGRALFAVVTDAKLSGTPATGNREAKPAAEWAAILARFFECERVKAGFAGFKCSLS